MTGFPVQEVRDVRNHPAGRPAHNVHVAEFEGPIELLLDLIRAHRMEITAISVAEIVDEYLVAVEGTTDLDLETASKFLLVAATLLHIKTQRLLPMAAEPDFDEELLADVERDMLLARLMNARTFADVAAVLRDSLEDGTRFVPRAVQAEEAVRRVAPDLLRQTTVGDLARLAAAALGRHDEPVPPMAHVEPIRVSLRATFLQLARMLPLTGTASYRSLCAGKSMVEAVVHFLAILELLKAGVIRVEQPTPRDDITMVWIGDEGWVPTVDVDLTHEQHGEGPAQPAVASSRSEIAGEVRM